MSKKKLDNRLDKLFENFDKEPETKQDPGPEESPKKTYRPTVFISTAGEAAEPISEIELPLLSEKLMMPENNHQPPSTMLSTAFRTDESNWATLKVIDEFEQRNWGAEEQLLVRQVADQLSLALENARLFQEAQRRAKEMTALAEVAREISATLELQQVMERIANQALLILNAVTCAVYVPDPEYKTLIAVTAIGSDADELSAETVSIGEGILGSIARSKVAEIINNASEDSRAVAVAGTENRPEQHLMAAPILSQSQLSGLLAVWRDGENERFSETELEFLASLAQQASIAVENARLFAETQERAEELSVLNEMARELSAEMNITAIAETAYRYVNRLLDTTNFYIALLDEASNLINFPVFIEQNSKSSLSPRKPENGLTEHVIQTGEPLFLAHQVSEEIESLGLKGILVGNREIPLCWLGVPLLVGSKPIGVMAVQSFVNPDLYTEHDKDLMITVASQVAIAMENARLFKDAQARARREKILREITARIRATNDPEMIAKAAVRELGQALNVPAFIRLGGKEVSSTQELETGKEKSKSKQTSQGGI
jgi:GAF domain-containing protein